MCKGQEHDSLDLTQSVYDKEIDYSFKIVDTVYRSDEFYNIAFQKEVYFSRATFQKGASFSEATFQKRASFSEATFQKEGYFTSDVFQKEANFRKATFQKEADFYDATFQKEAGFFRATFQKEAGFFRATFQEVAGFLFDTFQKKANFSVAAFPKVADFRWVTFQKDVDLSNLRLTDSSQFNFQDARLPDRLDFSYNLKIKNEIDLTTAYLDRDTLYTLKQKRWHYINLYKSDLSKIKMDYRHFRFLFYNTGEEDTLFHNWTLETRDTIKFAGKIYITNDPAIVDTLLSNRIFRDYIYHLFPGCRYYVSDGFYATLRDKVSQHFWKEYLSPKFLHTQLQPLYDSAIVDFTQSCIDGFFPRRLPDDEILSIYQQEIKIFTDRGATQSKQNLDIEYHDFMNGENFIPHIWNCYGYHKEWVFYWAFIFLVFFTGITFCCLPFLSGHVYTVSFFKPEDVKLRKPKATVAANAWYGYFMPPEETAPPRSFLQRLGGRVWYSIVYTAVIFFLFSLKIDNFKFSRKFSHIIGSIYIIIMYTAGITCLAYMANFVLQK